MRLTRRRSRSVSRTERPEPGQLIYCFEEEVFSGWWFAHLEEILKIVRIIPGDRVGLAAYGNTEARGLMVMPAVLHDLEQALDRHNEVTPGGVPLNGRPELHPVVFVDSVDFLVRRVICCSVWLWGENPPPANAERWVSGLPIPISNHVRAGKYVLAVMHALEGDWLADAYIAERRRQLAAERVLAGKIVVQTPDGACREVSEEDDLFKFCRSAAA